MKRCRIIAEVGSNHLGDRDLALDHIAAAAESGADFVKFQSWEADRLSPAWAKDLEYYSRCELSDDDHFFLKEACDKAGVNFLTTVFYESRLDFVRSVSPEYLKIASIDTSNLQLIEKAQDMFGSLIISTGMTDSLQVERVASVLTEDRHTLLHCVSEYPCKPEHARMNRMDYLRLFSSSVGLSCHASDIFAAMVAVARGADFVEKHFIIKHDDRARDNKVSITPNQLKELCVFRDTVYLLDSNKSIEPTENEMLIREKYTGKWG